MFPLTYVRVPIPSPHSVAININPYPCNPMKRIILCLFSLVALAGIGVHAADPAGLPTTQPKLLTIWREEVKIGRSAEHARNEAGFPAAYAKAKSPDHYLAMTSLTGPNEAWYIIPAASHAAIGESLKREDKDPVLSAELARLSLADAEYISGLRIIQAKARTDLTVGTFPDLAKARFFAITTLRVRPGHEAQFEAAAKALGAARMRVAPKLGYRVYQVIAGMPTPTFFIMASVENYADFDETTAAQEATLKALTPEELAVRKQFFTEGVISYEANRFKLDPQQSYVSDETRATDPAFWSPK